MISRTCAALAAFSAISLLLPVNAFAKGFAGHHGGFRHHAFHHHRGGWPYGGWLATYPQYYEPAAVIPTVITPTYSVAPRCTPSVETVTVPSENGGERRITITRCAR